MGLSTQVLKEIVSDFSGIDDGDCVVVPDYLKTSDEFIFWVKNRASRLARYRNFTEVIDVAEAFFASDRTLAEIWINIPNDRLGGRAPIDAPVSEVAELCLQIDFEAR